MFLKILLYLFCFIFNIVYCQICTRMITNVREVPETYMYTYTEAYVEPNCIFWCTETRTATAIGTKTVEKEVIEEEHICCDGYVKDETKNSSGLHCIPVCDPECENAFCKSPGHCVCNPGYMPTTFEPEKCVPLCLQNCKFGTCIAPNVCECDPGYVNKNNICVPICSIPCENGTCIAPDKCQCYAGFNMSDEGSCEPYCTSYTLDGQCIQSIQCDLGWEKVITGSVEQCKPTCTKPCINGKCIAPETCECLDGFIMSNLGTCEPYCSMSCNNGYCVRPETCACNPGWYVQEQGGKCVPHCDYFKCGNGTCIAPNECQCFEGYVNKEQDSLKEGQAACIPVCDDCVKPCSKVQDCICPSQMTPILVTDAGISCTVNTEKCKKISCIAFDTDSEETTGKYLLNNGSVHLVVIGNNIETSNSENNDDSFDDEKLTIASWGDIKMICIFGSIFILASLVVVIMSLFLKGKYCRSDDSTNENLSMVPCGNIKNSYKL